MSFIFKPAEKVITPVKIALTGPANSGKTMGALKLAKGFGGKIAVIDTENNSSTLYSKLDWSPQFDVLDFGPPYSPERFVLAIGSAEKAGYDTIIIDSASHEWNGAGGCLEINDIEAQRLKSTWAAWSVTTPKHRAFVDKILQSNCNIIATMRSKTETIQQEINGKKKVVKLGMKPEQRDGIEYEFSIVLEIDQETHFITASKDRSMIFESMGNCFITEQLGEIIKNWFSDGVDIYNRYYELINQVQSLDELKKIWDDVPSFYKKRLDDHKNAKKIALTDTKTNPVE